MTTDVNADAGQPAPNSPDSSAQAPAANNGAPKNQKSEPPVLRMKSPKQAQSDQSASDGAEELENLLNRAVEQIGESERNYESALDDLGSEINTLSDKTSAVRESGQSDANLQQLETQVSSLSQQVERADQNLQGESENDILTQMERRIAALAADPNTNPGSPPPSLEAPPPSIPAEPKVDEAALDERFKSVTSDLEESLHTAAPAEQLRAVASETQQISQTLSASTEPSQIDAIAERLRGLEGYLVRAEEQYSRIGSIETHLRTLMDGMNGSATQIEEVARRSAREAAELVQASSSSMSVSERLDAIQAELRGLNARAAQTDDRTVGTLEVMNGTLKMLADKVASGPQAQHAGGPSDGGRADSSDHAQVRISRNVDEPGGRGPGGGGPNHPLDLTNVGASIPDYQAPPVQGQAQPAAQPYRQAQNNSPASQGALAVSDADFIASARRAAQAVASQQPAGAVNRPSHEGLPRPQQPMPEANAPAAKDAKKPRRLLVFAAASLLVVSAALLYNRLKTQGDATSIDGPAHLVPRDDIPAPAPVPQQKQPDKQGALSGGNAIPAKHVVGATSNSTASVPHHLLGASDLPAVQFSIAENTKPFAVRQSPGNRPGSTSTATKVAKPTPVPMPPEGIGSTALRQASAKGDPRAQFEIATRFAKGTGVPRDFVSAAQWYARSASQGFAPAQYRLAALYERGRGLKRDQGRARIWYQRAAEAGNVKAMHNLAVLHTKQNGKTPDYANASQWFSKAAEYGLSDSQFNLGILYENGLGTRKDLKQAYKWFQLAAKGGDTEAAKRASGLTLQILPEDKVRIEADVATWQPKTENASANKVTPPKASWKKAAAAPRPPVKADPVVARAQALLNQLGYTAGEPDGLMGPKTRAAIESFQGSLGLERTGRATPKLITQLEMRAS
jgi:localization factor PodJL